MELGKPVKDWIWGKDGSSREPVRGSTEFPVSQLVWNSIGFEVWRPVGGSVWGLILISIERMER